MKIVNDRQEFLKELSLHSVDGYSSFAEIGVYQGDFSELVLSIINPSWLVLIDPYKESNNEYKNGLKVAYSNQEDYKIVVRKFSRQISKGGVSIYSLNSEYAVQLFPDLYFDFVYHDASHLYEDVIRDLVQWERKVKVNGLICGHDYIKHEDFGVIEAVDKFCDLYNFEMIIFNKNGGDYALRRK